MATDEVLLFEDADFEMDVDSLPPSQLEDEHTGAQLQVPHLTVAGSDTDGEATDKETDEDAASDTSRYVLTSHVLVNINSAEYSSSIIDQLEKIVLDFLEQLLHAMPGADGTNSTQGRKRKIVIELVDRRKPTKDDGCAYILLWLPRSCTDRLVLQITYHASARLSAEGQTRQLKAYRFVMCILRAHIPCILIEI